MLNILVVGAGAIGCFVGGRLAAAGHTVTLLGRPALMNKIAVAGLSLYHPNQPPQTVRPETVTVLDSLSTAYDFILITVKAPDTSQVIEDLQGSGLPLAQAHLVSLQNGIGNEESLADAFNPQKIIAGTITIPISVPEQGVVAVSKDKGGLGLASLHPSQPVQVLADALIQAGLSTLIYDDYRAMKWSKLLLNIVNNASSAILDLPPAQIIANPSLFDMEIEAIREGVAVMRALGLRAVKLPGYPVDWLARLVSATWLPLPLKRTALRPSMQGGRGSKMPSLHIDLSSGRRRSEVAVLNGAVARAGRDLGITTPVNQTLTDLLAGLTSGSLDKANFHHRPDKLLQAINEARSQSKF